MYSFAYIQNSPSEWFHLGRCVQEPMGDGYFKTSLSLAFFTFAMYSLCDVRWVDLQKSRTHFYSRGCFNVSCCNVFNGLISKGLILKSGVERFGHMRCLAVCPIICFFALRFHVLRLSAQIYLT